MRIARASRCVFMATLAATVGQSFPAPAASPALRGFKGQLFEGGHRVPFLARWPGKIRPGTSDQLICHVDFTATFANLVGQKLPADAAPDSFNILPALLGETNKPVRDHLVHHVNGPKGALASRKGTWKAIPAVQAPKGKQPALGPQLYSLADDLAETRNLAEQRPEVVRDLTALLDKIRREERSRP